jgi:hypothetical protein
VAALPLRGVANAAAYKEFDAAVELDPSLAAAHLRRAVYMQDSAALPELQRHFAQAAGLRSMLDARDQALLDAFEPLYSGSVASIQAERRARWAEVRRRLFALEPRYTRDAEIAYFAARFRPGDFYDRMLDLDPRFALALYERSRRQQEESQVEAAKATLAQCIEVAPDASSCRFDRASPL